ncbi:MAG: ribosome maturation factor RimP [Pyrinomonadaceae bacterium]|nr:ribosome maturation factor RimP [Pyrinomonadaceae bacterium]
MSDSKINERVKAVAESVAAQLNLELVRAEVAGTERSPTVRVFIYKEGGVTHGDCADFSLHVGTILDVEDFISDAYTLEVSSPGLERELYELKDYEKFAGSLAKLRTRKPINEQRNFRGRIIGTNVENVIFDDKTGGQIEIPIEIIAKANLEIDIEQELKRSAK